MMSVGLVEQYRLYEVRAAPNAEPDALSQLILTFLSRARTETLVHDAVLAAEVAEADGDEFDPPHAERQKATIPATSRKRTVSIPFSIK
jgi:hypothetical protein